MPHALARHQTTTALTSPVLPGLLVLALTLGPTLGSRGRGALALIAAEVVIDRAVLPKVQRRMPLKAAAGANRSH